MALLTTMALTMSPAQAATYNVTFGSFFFSPNSLTIDAGDTVVWNGPQGHTVTGTSGGDPFCGNGQTTSCSRTFNTPGTFSYQCNVGNHAAQGMVGNITVRVRNQLPSIQFTVAPSALTVVRGGGIVVSITASDPDGSINQVEVFATGGFGPISLGSASSEPYNFTASTTSLTPGNYALTARATDNQGGSTTSSEYQLTVQPPPAVRLTKVQRSGKNIILSWSGGIGPFVPQVKFSLKDATWADLPAYTTSEKQATLTDVATFGALYFRLRDAGQD